jgi:YD repeat-containing protein
VDEPTSNGLGTVSSPNQPTIYEYDGNSNLTKVIQSDGTTMQNRLFKYDSLSRLIAEKQVEANATLSDDGTFGTADPATKWTKVMKYDSHGFLTDAYDARGVHSQFYYDGLNRISSATYSDGTPNVTYTYDQARSDVNSNPYQNKNRLTRIETAVGGTTRPDTPSTATEFDYDKTGQVKAQRQIIGTQIYNLGYTYNLAGQLMTETYPSGKVITNNYDAAGRLSGVADAQTAYLGTFQYQGTGGALSSYSLGNGTTEPFTLNDRLQLTSQSLKHGTDVLQKYEYAFGQMDGNNNPDPTKNNGQLAQIDSYIRTAKQFTQKFNYDSIGRLAESKEYRGDTNALSYKQHFDYDRFGNLYRKAASNATTGQQTPIAFTPIEDTDISKSTNRLTNNTTYDDAGNVTIDAKFRNLKYFYDANGRMFKTTDANNTNEADSVYDALGQRVAQKISGVWTNQVYDAGGKLVAEYGQSSTSEGGVKYVFQDWQGSVRAVTNRAGFIDARMDYRAFGEEITYNIGQRSPTLGYSSAPDLNQGYGLTERDKPTGLSHAGWRKLEQNAGRWQVPIRTALAPQPETHKASIGILT